KIREGNLVKPVSESKHRGGSQRARKKQHEWPIRGDVRQGNADFLLVAPFLGYFFGPVLAASKHAQKSDNNVPAC
ncbi:MAG TPA: hypothetical protein PLA77_09215, partial [Bacteroidales bacterium]|nr:hypothetical protein [Bacteroidales bacterium]